MKKIAMLIVSLLFLGVQLVNAQNKTLTGTVISSEDNQPLPGVNVVVKGTTQGTITDFDGKFTLNVSADAEALVFSFMGMQTQEVPIGSTTTFNVTLDPESIGMDEVVVVAYGTSKKSSFTGSATQVKGSELEKMKVSDVSKALEGKVAGVQMTSTSGTPGSSGKILIRGIGSISASQEPLIVVDGVPYEGKLNSISQQDIESYTILKDAAANSMYGARGSNGVIIITTKKGKSGKPQVNAEASVGFNSRGVSNYDIITNPNEYYEMMYESIRNSLVDNYGYLDASDRVSKNLISQYLKFNVYKDVADDNIIDPNTGKLTEDAKNAQKKWNDSWVEDPFKAKLRQEYNVNVSGGGEVTNAYLSMSYLDDNGYVTNSGFNREAARLKVEHKVGSNIKVEGNVAYAKTERRAFANQTESNYSNLFMFSQFVGPIYPIYKYDKDGNLQYNADGTKAYEYGSPFAPSSNPIAQLEAGINKYLVDNLSSRGMFEVKFLKDFKFTANIAYDLFVTNNTIFQTPIGGDAATVGGRGYKESERYGALNANQLLNYTHDFGLHNVKLLLGHEINKVVSNYMFGHMTNFVNPDNPEFANASQYQDLTSYTTATALEGYMARAEYEYNDRYYLNASIRRDASSQFHPDSRWGTFWAVGAAWRINEENFLRDVEAVNSLKLKVSYGTQGNNDLGLAKVYTDLYRVDRVDGEPALTKELRGNPDLTWEKSANFNAGFESRFLDRFDLNVDFFMKETKDMIYQHPMASSEGAPSYIWKNEMNMRNTGVEIEAIVDIVNTNDIKWNVTFNGMTYKNKLTKLAEGKPDDGYQAGYYWRKKGGSLYDWYTYKYAGVDKETGKAMYWHEDEETGEKSKVYSTSDATLYQQNKSAIPDFVGGISTSVEAYGFDLSISTAYQIGGWVWDSFYQSLMNGGEKGQNMHKDMFNRWTPGNTDSDIPALNFSEQEENGNCDRWLTKASYFSLKNVTLGYSLPSSVLEKVKIDKMRFYITGDNIWLFSKRKGLDPRQSFSGETGYIYSALSTYTAGVKITF
jgi:TonB-linked SusC/RagA family outer membrane protein